VARLSLSSSEEFGPRPFSLGGRKLARAGSAGPAVLRISPGRREACESLVGEKESLRCVADADSPSAGIARL
jgi:hypothetical protein